VQRASCTGFADVELPPAAPTPQRCLAVAARHRGRAGQERTLQRLLRGKNLGLMCATGTTPDALLFRRAAEELGAHVAHLLPSLSDRSAPQELQHTARLLGRLYDAVEMQGLANRLVRQIGDEARVPVFDGLATTHHATAAITASLGAETSPADNRRFVLQAVLLGTIG
jgi:ornithine carbamoyltransferase